MKSLLPLVLLTVIVILFNAFLFVLYRRHRPTYFCSNGHICDRHDKFCSHCGANVFKAPNRRCPAGHKIYGLKVTFCPRCGENIEGK